MAKSATFSIGTIRFDPASGELRSQGSARRLEPRAADVLRLLCEEDGQLVSRQTLLGQCWGEGQGSDEALTQAIAQGRKALQELSEPDRIETLAKRGYRITLEHSSAPITAAPSRPWRRLILLTLGLMVAALALLLFAFPHQIKHSVRHALGFDTMTATDPDH